LHPDRRATRISASLANRGGPTTFPSQSLYIYLFLTFCPSAISGRPARVDEEGSNSEGHPQVLPSHPRGEPTSLPRGTRQQTGRGRLKKGSSREDSNFVDMCPLEHTLERRSASRIAARDCTAPSLSGRTAGRSRPWRAESAARARPGASRKPRVRCLLRTMTCLRHAERERRIATPVSVSRLRRSPPGSAFSPRYRDF
jgi:hypothetical protein